MANVMFLRITYRLALATVLVVTANEFTRAGGLGESSDLEVGGPGAGAGEFLGLNDFTFDGQNRLYVLDGRYWDPSTNRERMGNDCVHVFTNDGRYLTRVSLAPKPSIPSQHAGGSKEHRPTRIAVDSRDNVFVTEPEIGAVLQYAPPAGFSDAMPAGDWKLVHTYPIPDAFAVAVGRSGKKDRVLVVPHRRQNDRPVLFDSIAVIDPQAMAVLSPISLTKPLGDTDDLAIDSQGAIYAVASQNQLVKYDAEGKWIFTMGAGTRMNREDGSELQHSVAIDSRDNFYCMTPGNPGSVSRFDSRGDSVALVPGEFKWADPWGPQSQYMPLAIDGRDRLWVASTGIRQPGTIYHPRPCVLRVRKDFFSKAKAASTRNLGVDARIEVKDLPYNLAYELKPIHAQWLLKPASRRVAQVTLDTFVYDMYKNEIAHSRAAMELKDGEESHQPIDFTPPAFGWYTIECQLRDSHGEYLSGVAEHVGVTPKFPGMPTLADGDSPGGWCDPAKFAFSGLKLIRANTQEGIDGVEKFLQGAAKYDLNLLVQFERREHCADDVVRSFVTHFKGRVKYWEIINEPNTSMSSEDYIALVKRVVPIIKQVDPSAQVMGPDTVGVNLNWNEAVFQSGAAALFDIISIHDYEGDEAISPQHWRWKIGKLRELMAKYGLAEKPIWQTERAIEAVRGNELTVGVQAVRMALHRDLLESLGIPSEHNHHYYMNQVGYSQVPSYLFSANGPYPALLALRARHAMLANCVYKETLDFGPHGNDLFFGLRFAGKDGDTIALHQLGAASPPTITLGVTGGSLDVVDSFGNSRAYPVAAGKVALTVPPLPLYLRLKPGQTITPPKYDFGVNFARGAAFSYSSSYEGSFDILTNGRLEATQAGNPWGPYWKGSLKGGPQTLEIEFPIERSVNRMFVYSLEADNPHCALLDFDVQALDGAKWNTVKQVRTTIPPSQYIKSADSRADTWYLGQNWTAVTFPAVRTRKIRLVALRTTFGFQPDELAVAATGWKANDQTLCLREIEIYGESPLKLAATAPSEPIVKRAPIEIAVDATGLKGAFSGSLRPMLPEGWTADPASIRIDVSTESKSAHVVFKLIPAEQTLAGTKQERIDAVDDHGATVDCAFARFTLSPSVRIDPQPLGRDQQGRLQLRVKTYPLVKRKMTGMLTAKIAIGEQTVDDVKPIELPVGKAENEFAFLPDATDVAGKTIVATFTAHIDGGFDSSETRLLSEIPIRFLGPFDNEGGHQGFDAVYPPETELELSKTYPTVDGRATWKQGATSDGGFFNLREQFKTRDNVVAYAVSFVYSPDDRPALLSCGSDDGIKAWLNRELILSHDIHRGVAARQEVAPVKLHQGWNSILLKITQMDGGWALFLELTDANHQPLAGVRFADSPTSVPKPARK